MSSKARLSPCDRVGILGGGQLGRMLATAGARLGLDVVIFDPQAGCPASRVAAETITAPYEDLEAVARFAKSVDAVTYEFENVPVETAAEAARHAPLRPGVQALEVAQDRFAEKSFLNQHTAPTVAFKPVESADDALAAVEAIGVPSVLKTRRFGYDGKGQAVVREAGAAGDAFVAISQQPAILEAFAPFVRELSVIAARSLDGQMLTYPLCENAHADGILRETRAPASVSPEIAAEAVRIAEAILTALDYVGVLAVELFELKDGRLLVNEIAPRVHNTGHWTEAACRVSQFEQHMRAVAGWALSDPAPIRRARMINLIGDDVEGWADWLANPRAVLTLYGKRQTRAGRKMGHVTVLED
ncbi:5-(carboxyamino)imidazole ribonucleotide synthase [Maricaulaceae bacterium EIL42A08]|nr:5-(carboxyamino)imidazole ribonucleotide synthase [Maricaulaceae bacterium EIL42A08]